MHVRAGAPRAGRGRCHGGGQAAPGCSISPSRLLPPRDEGGPHRVARGHSSRAGQAMGAAASTAGDVGGGAGGAGGAGDAGGEKVTTLPADYPPSTDPSAAPGGGDGQHAQPEVSPSPSVVQGACARQTGGGHSPQNGILPRRCPRRHLSCMAVGRCAFTPRPAAAQGGRGGRPPQIACRSSSARGAARGDAAATYGIGCAHDSSASEQGAGRSAAARVRREPLTDAAPPAPSIFRAPRSERGAHRAAAAAGLARGRRGRDGRARLRAAALLQALSRRGARPRGRHRSRRGGAGRPWRQQRPAALFPGDGHHGAVPDARQGRGAGRVRRGALDAPAQASRGGLHRRRAVGGQGAQGAHPLRLRTQARQGQRQQGQGDVGELVRQRLPQGRRHPQARYLLRSGARDALRVRGRGVLRHRRLRPAHPRALQAA